MDKEQLRKEKIKARDALSETERAEQSAAICRAVMALPEYRAARTVMLYKAVRGEVRLDLPEEEADDRRFVYPFCTGPRQMQALLPGTWVRGAYGIPAPDPADSRVISPEGIDLVICPCTAFDEAGHRLGMGGGYYDAFLKSCGNARVIAVAFSVQRTEHVPVEEHDLPVERVITELDDPLGKGVVNT